MTDSTNKPAESFGARMARLRRERAASTAPAAESPLVTSGDLRQLLTDTVDAAPVDGADSSGVKVDGWPGRINWGESAGPSTAPAAKPRKAAPAAAPAKPATSTAPTPAPAPAPAAFKVRRQPARRSPWIMAGAMLISAAVGVVAAPRLVDVPAVAMAMAADTAESLAARLRGNVDGADSTWIMRRTVDVAGFVNVMTVAAGTLGECVDIGGRLFPNGGFDCVGADSTVELTDDPAIVAGPVPLATAR